VINGGDATTKKVEVALSHPATDPETGVELMRISQDGVFDTEPWVRYASTSSLTLQGKGVRTVYVQFANPLKMISATFSDSILFKP
jgi:hypothetical protein